MLLRKRCRSLLCQLQVLVLLLALVLLLVMVAILDPEVQSEDSSGYVYQHHGTGQRWAGSSLLEQSEDSNQYKVELLSPLSSLRDEELIAIGIPEHGNNLEKIRRNIYKIVKHSKRKNEVDIEAQNEHTEQGRNRQEFNENGSQKIPLHRAVPEGRHPLCHQQIYTDNLPTTSVIICFHNEAWSTLLRTVHSILDNSPRKMLKEIILVDDLSYQGHLKSALSEYISFIGGVKLIRSNRRLGVIGGRMLGAARATGEILVFMDPHCECHPGWLEPLLSRIMNNRNRIVSPILDVIDWKMYDYYHSPDLRHGVFDWKLDFHWVTLAESEEKVRQSPITPFRTPVIPGSVIAVDRHYFQNIGAFDTGMEYSGVESIELSIRVWLCGGSVEIVPCSRVGHLSQIHSTTNRTENDAILINKIRIAEVWMDSYKEVFYQNIGKELLSNLSKKIDVTDREQLRLRLGCKGFQWFLENIYSEINTSVSVQESSVLLYNTEADSCVQAIYNNRMSHHMVELSDCSVKMNQLFVYRNKKIRSNFTESLCFDLMYDQIVVTNCSVKEASMWDFNEAGQLIHIPTGKCVETVSIETGKTFLFLSLCKNNQGNQTWKMIPV
ncbi:PREDICTED: polypeptide N-acetylgalactosaminyltransferase 15 [Nanorana parkeri]|uniref:polypeptide N-acetylgalactosaminyltransferase 15 n=1 Tax=Nanorana parkeri TaxID=125878 RepID=UPI000854F5BD|nr:PREDICTED: polypeptide N-acetylgalactosaminyltransferase 15 [Nanorana parkeri]